MPENHARDMMSSVGPDPVQHDEIVPGRGVDKGKERDPHQGEGKWTVDSTRDPQADDDRNPEKDRQKFRVGHALSLLGSGYQRGILASIPAVIAASLVTTAEGAPSPLEAPAEWLMEWTPLPLATFLLLHASALTHPAALLGALALMILVGGVAGCMAGLVGHVPLQALLAGLLFTASDLAFFGARLSGSLLVLAAVFVLSFLAVSIRRTVMDGRREFLLRSAAVVGGALILLGLSVMRSAAGAVTTRRLFAFRPTSGLRIAGLSDLITPVRSFYVMDKVLDYPDTAIQEWHLTVDGGVARPLALDISSLQALPAHHRFVTLECVDNPVGGPMIGNALWTGVRVRDVLQRVGATGTVAVFEAADNYSESLPLSVVNRVDALIAYGMNGETLSRAHGYPARLVVPGLYGFKSVKWLTGIRLTTAASPGEWAAHGWNEMPQIHTTARIDVARRRGASVLLAGIAFAGVRGVRAVQVRVNGGAWQQARLRPALASESWAQWAAQVRCAGPCTVEARAVDGDGRPQTSNRHGAYPAGASGWDSISL